MTVRIRVLLVDDHPVVVRGLRTICAEAPAVEIIGEASTGHEALCKTTTLRPEVVVLPIRLGGTRSGVEVSREIENIGKTRVVVFTSFARPVDVQVAALAGAWAFVSKSAHPEIFIETIHRVAAGERPIVLEPGKHRSDLSREWPASEGLTEREQHILGLVLEGLTNQAITERLTIEMSTVKTHMRSILRKLGVGSRRDLL